MEPSLLPSLLLIITYSYSVAKLHNLITGKQRATGKSELQHIYCNITTVRSYEEEIPQGGEVGVSL